MENVSMAKNLKVGERVRAKVRTSMGWKGSGTIISVNGIVRIVKDDDPRRCADFLDDQLARYYGAPIMSPYPNAWR
jgi:hypothetical protein